VDSEIHAVEIDKRICSDFGWELTTHEAVDRFLGKFAESFAAQLEDHLDIQFSSGWEANYQPMLFAAFDAGVQSVAALSRRSMCSSMLRSKWDINPNTAS